MLPTPSSLTLRTELETLALQDLLGPAGGATEVVEEPTVRGRYILGILAPRGQSAQPEEQDELAEGGADTQDGKPPSPRALNNAMFPSSMGLTFSVDGAAKALTITAQWGRYQRVRSETLRDHKGDFKLVWQRTPVRGEQTFALQAGRLGPWRPDPENTDVYVEGRVRQRGGVWTLTLFLVNAQPEPKQLRDAAALFQPELRVRAPDHAPIFLKRPLPRHTNPGADDEDKAMSMLYRRQVEFAVGHGVSVAVEKPVGEWERATALRTAIVPTAEVERMDAPSPADLPALSAVVTDMRTLAETTEAGFAAALSPLAEAYEAWIDAQAAQLTATPVVAGLNVTPPLDLGAASVATPLPLSRPLPADLAPYQLEAEAALARCREALTRIRAGIALLGQNPLAAQAFRFANRAMWQQRIHALFSRAGRQGQTAPLESFDQPHNRRWFPFQLAFILLNLPALVDPAHPDRCDLTQAKADLLWFPTGGGKTEAYLGVAAFTIGLRRLLGMQGDPHTPQQGAGLAVLMRYTLRLLTLQQFQRATALLCACEVIRRENPAVWGAEPFRIGLWVGQSSTPNRTADSAEAIKHLRNQNAPSGKGTPAQLTNCPWCGAPINAGRDLEVDVDRTRTLQYCSDLTTCAFNRKNAPGEGLPVLVVDEEIYRRLPALLIATVDKFAQMPWKGETQMLFGKINGYCPRHGYRAPEIEDSDAHPKKGPLPACKTQPLTRLRPPDLIIQDELHLISGPLGTLVGLYETAVDALATWDYRGVKVRPKVIASTATIRRARQQVQSLFLREVQIFPPAGLNVEDNFFARRRPSTPQTPGRRYLGLCAPGMRLKTLLIRVYVAFMAAAQTLYKKYELDADTYLTLIGYFNSLRELGGMRRVVDDAVRTRLRQMDERGLEKRYIEPWSTEELTSRRSATDIPKILDRLEAVFNPQTEAERQRRRKAGEDDKRDFSKVPYDVVLATNMISVGVDVSRLGLMVVAGQPKATAEYIQATSRVGRATPGLVITVYNWARPRDLSHYERFSHYHATFYQQVEALSVTPFSPRALDRGLTAVLVAYLRLFEDTLNRNHSAGQLTSERAAQWPLLQQAVAAISQRAGLVEGQAAVTTLVQQMLKERLDEWQAQAQAITGGAILGYQAKQDGLTRALLKQPTDVDKATTRFICLNSLRDVEPNVGLVMNNFGMDREPNTPFEPTP